MDLSRITVFASVAEKASFTAAAKELRLTKSAVSQHIKALESQLGVSLLVRTTRRVSLTAAGELYYQSCRRIIAEAEVVVDQIRAMESRPHGKIKVTTTTDFGERQLATAIAEYRRLYPEVSFELNLEDSVTDLVASRFDLAIRIGWPRDSSYRVVKIGVFEQRLVASKAYLTAAAGHVPKRPEDLASHAWIGLDILENPYFWEFTRPSGGKVRVHVNGPMVTNNPLAVRALLLAGAGLSVLPSYMVADDIAAHRLVHLLANHTLRPGGIFAMYPAQEALPLRVRSFVEFLRERSAR